LPRLIADRAEALPDVNAAAFGALFDRFADQRIVLVVKRAMAPRNSTALAPPLRDA